MTNDILRDVYAMKAAIVALLDAGVAPRSGRGWGHDFVQAQFAGHLIGRRKRYSAALRATLPVYLLIEQPLERIAEQVKTGIRSRDIEPLSALFR